MKNLNMNESVYVFVYGTLMRGQYNHHYLNSSRFCGTAALDGFRMYDLGSFPGIVAGRGRVFGELYRIDQAVLMNLDRLEGNGSLYNRETVSVKKENGSSVRAYVYVYLHDISRCRRLYNRYGDPNPYVWYVSYGSNMLSDRQRYYIQGGLCPANGKYYEGCADTRMPVEIKSVMIPYNMYYSNYGMGSWENSAVSFLNLSHPGRAYGRAYKITLEQLHCIHEQEGLSENWYPELYRLPDIDGIPAYTCAGRKVKVREPLSRVSEAYKNVLMRGLEEAWPNLTEQQAVDYLNQCGDIDGK